MAINFGLLQPTAPNISTQVVSLPNYAQQNADGFLKGINTGSEVAARNAEQARQQALLPGQLQGQKLTNEGLELQNQEKQNSLNATQYQIQMRTDRIKAYEDAKQNGGIDAGLDAMQNKFLDQGDHESYLKMAEEREKLQHRIQQNDQSYLTNMGTMAHTIMTTAGTKGITPLDEYKEQYKAGTIKRFDPKAPSPESFKNNDQFEDTYIHPVLDKALPFQQAEAQKQQELLKNQFNQSTLLVDSARTRVKDAVSKYGANSKEAKEAADDYNMSIKYRNSIVGGKGELGQIGTSLLKKFGFTDKFEQTPAEITGQPTTDSTSTNTPNNSPQNTKQINGIMYINQNGKWYQQ